MTFQVTAENFELTYISTCRYDIMINQAFTLKNRQTITAVYETVDVIFHKNQNRMKIYINTCITTFHSSYTENTCIFNSRGFAPKNQIVKQGDLIFYSKNKELRIKYLITSKTQN